MNPEVFRAASSGDSSFFENLVESRSNTLQQQETIDLQQQATIEKNTVLHVALQFKKFEAAESIVNSIPSLMYKTNSKGNTPLHVAARVGKFSMVKLLIGHAEEQDIERLSGGRQRLLSMVNQDGDTALHVALRYDNDDQFEIVKELIKADPELAKHVNKARESALFLAVDRELYDMASHILKVDNCSYHGRHGMNVLHALVIRTSSFTLRELKNYGQASAYHRCMVIWVWVVKMVYSRYPLTKFQSRELENFRLRKVFALLVPGKFGTFPETNGRQQPTDGDQASNSSSRMAEHIRSEIGLPHLDVLPDGATPQPQASLLPQPQEIVGGVIKKWQSTSEKDDDLGWRFIIEQSDDSGWTPLHLAAYLGNAEIIKLLLERKKSLAYAKNKEGLSALHIAAMEGNLSVMRELMEACPDIYELLDNRGQTALHAAAESGQLLVLFTFLKIIIWFECLVTLISRITGFEDLMTRISEQNEEGNTPIYQAVTRGITGFKGLMTLISEQDEEGNTPIYLAVVKGYFMSLKWLGSFKGVDLNATNKEGFTTMDKLILGRASFGLEVWKKHQIKPFWKKGARPSLRGAMRIRNLDPTGKPEQTGDGNGKSDGDGEERSVSDFGKRVSETNSVVATLIATMTFTAAFTVPGGYNQNGNVDEGLAVLRKNTAFLVFLIANTLAFGLSTTSVFVHFLGSAAITGNFFLSEVVRHSISFTNWSVGALLVAFISGTYAVVPHFWGTTVAITLCCCFLISLFFPFFIKKYY